MIKLIHRYKQSIGIVFLFIAFCFVVSGPGLDILHDGGNKQRDAVTVNDKEFSYQDLDRAKQNIESRYRQMFGENFAQLAQSLRLNINQQALDNLIDTAVLDQAAQEQGFVANDDSVRKYILTTIFKDTPYSAAAYRNLLQSVGMSAPQFEREIKKDVSRSTLLKLIEDAAIVTDKDVEARFIKQNTKFSFVAAEISPSAILATLPTPSDADLKKLYEANATDYSLPAQVSYSYHVVSPVDFEKDVQVSRQDLEFYYSENASKYATPEQTRIRVIKLLYPKESDPSKMAAVRQKATTARDEALSGKPFADLVTKYSDDLPAKLAGGDAGWVVKGSRSEAFDNSVAKTVVGGISELIETDYGFEIVKVEEKKAAATRPLEEVRAEIEKSIKSQEAPSYAANAARELVEKAKKGNLPLAQALTQAGRSAKETTLVPDSSDPEPDLKGLTQQVFLLPSAERLMPAVIELGDASVVVQVKEFKEPSIPTFESVREKVTALYKEQEAKKLAATKADELLKAVQQNGTDFSKEATTKQASVVGPKTITRESSTVDGFASFTGEMRNAVLTSQKAGTVLPQVFSSPKGQVVLKVTEIAVPNLSDPAVVASLSKYREQAAQELTQAMTTSILAQMKANAQIDVDPALLAQ